MPEVRIVASVPALPNWTDRLDEKVWDSWACLETLLRQDPKWKDEQVDSVAAESLRVLRHLPDPRSNHDFQGRGLVVGYVQSGKTANYTAVAARAVDAGYRLIVILSGIHDALRSQTQKRLERELVGVGSSHHQWKLLTGEKLEFFPPPPGALDHGGPFLIVAKKIVPVLKRLDEWLEGAGDRLHWLPTLLIDDEADQASINTKGNRTPDAMVSEAEDEKSGESKPSSTNAMIRSILNRLPRASYVAYTATPFANIFIDPNALDRKVGQDLFPRDFALQLPRPGGYTGTEELFGVSAGGRDVLRFVPEEDVVRLRSSKKGRGRQVTIDPDAPIIPDTLAEALGAFCIAGGIRQIRDGSAASSHTMLVHVSQLVADQTRISGAIREQIDLWRSEVSQSGHFTEWLGTMLESHFRGVTLPELKDRVIEVAINVLKQLVVIELNSETGENLEYDEKPGRHIVAVGGNRLSRGLTLEGLTISYFLRTTSMSDTLLQMARWYGFRTDYEDLIRIWTTPGIARWFAELALVEDALRESLQALTRAGKPPSEMAIRLRAHSELLLTSRNKSGMSADTELSWSGEHPQTVLLPVSDHSKLQRNFELTDQLIAELRPSFAIEGGMLAQDVPAETVARFLREYKTHDDILAFQPDALSDWIEQSNEAGELVDWSVFLAGSGAGRKMSIGGTETGMLTRSRVSSDSIGILIDPRHEGVDLPGGPQGYKRASGTYDSQAMRAARPRTQGLLIIYPLDPANLGTKFMGPVIALALSLPQTAETGSWVVNRGVADA